MRVEIHPHYDRWMMGDRFGRIVRSGKLKDGRAVVYVKLEISGKTVCILDGEFTPR